MYWREGENIGQRKRVLEKGRDIGERKDIGQRKSLSDKIRVYWREEGFTLLYHIVLPFNDTGPCKNDYHIILLLY